MPPRAVLQALQRDDDQRTGRGNFFLFPCDPIHPVFSEQGAVSRCSVKCDTYENDGLWHAKGVIISFAQVMGNFPYRFQMAFGLFWLAVEAFWITYKHV